MIYNNYTKCFQDYFIFLCMVIHSVIPRHRGGGALSPPSPLRLGTRPGRLVHTAAVVISQDKSNHCHYQWSLIHHYCHYVASYICTTCPPQRIGSTVTSSYWPGWSTDWREYRSISYPWHKPFWTFLSRITFLLTATSACLYYIMQWLYDLCYCWKYTIVAPTQILVGGIYSNVRVKHTDLGFVFSGLY